jgi:hypothetical protein
MGMAETKVERALEAVAERIEAAPKLPELIAPERRPFGHAPGARLSRVHVAGVLARTEAVVRSERGGQAPPDGMVVGHIVGLDLALAEGRITLTDEAAAWLSRVYGRRLNLVTARKLVRERLAAAYRVIEGRLP